MDKAIAGEYLAMTKYTTIGSVTLIYDSEAMRKAIEELSLRMDAFIEDGGKYRLTIEKVEETGQDYEVNDFAETV